MMNFCAKFRFLANFRKFWPKNSGNPPKKIFASDLLLKDPKDPDTFAIVSAAKPLEVVRLFAAGGAPPPIGQGKPRPLSKPGGFGWPRWIPFLLWNWNLNRKNGPSGTHSFYGIKLVEFLFYNKIGEIPFKE